MSRVSRQPMPEKQDIWQAQYNARLISTIALEALLFGTGLRGERLQDRARDYYKARQDHDNANSRRK